MAKAQERGEDARCLSVREMASYCQLTTNGVRSWVSRGILPPPLPGTRRWDRKAVDVALDRLSGLKNETVEENDFDRWLRENGEG